MVEMSETSAILHPPVGGAWCCWTRSGAHFDLLRYLDRWSVRAHCQSGRVQDNLRYPHHELTQLWDRLAAVRHYNVQVLAAALR